MAREVVKIENDFLFLESGGRGVACKLAANKRWVTVWLYDPASLTAKSRLCLRYAGREIELGQFLNDDEKKNFAKVLIKQCTNSVRKHGFSLRALSCRLEYLAQKPLREF